MILELILVCAVAAALLSLLALLAARGRGDSDLPERIAQLVRAEADRIRSEGAERDRATRQELTDNLRGFQTATVGEFTALGRQLGDQVRDFGDKLDGGLRSEREQFDSFAGRLTDNLAAINNLLHRSLADMVGAAETRQRELADLLHERLRQMTEAGAEASRSLRGELTENVQRLNNSLTESLTQLGARQQERLEELTRTLGAQTESQTRAQEALRTSVESRLDAIRTESALRLDEMRRTVDERLQSTLEARLNESFRTVSEQLERVHQGLGEMQSLATGVGDLKRVLSNVRVRGAWGEIQLETLLEQFLAADQFSRQTQVREGSQERVDFAIRLPGRDGEHEVLLPIDAKFPHDDYERLVAAAETGDGAGVETAALALEARVKECARSIQEKYINPPLTTDIAILFLPTESLYAEVLRRPGLFELIQRDYHVTLAGPTTLTAILNALQMGFRSLAIERRSGEVWALLGAIRSEFGKYEEVVGTLRRQLDTAVNTVDRLGTRSRVMNRRLRGVEMLPENDAQNLLGLSGSAIDESDEQGEEADSHTNGRG